MFSSSNGVTERLAHEAGMGRAVAKPCSLCFKLPALNAFAVAFIGVHTALFQESSMQKS